MRRSAPQPRSRKTPRGGMKMAQMILMMSLRCGLATVIVVQWCRWLPRGRKRQPVMVEAYDPVKGMLAVV